MQCLTDDGGVVILTAEEDEDDAKLNISAELSSHARSR